MNKISKKLVIFLALFIGSCFNVFPVQAQTNELTLEVTKECNIQYAGDSCVAELKTTNNTEKIVNGKAFLHIDYQGICGDGFFDGEGINAQFSITGENNNWQNFSGWKDGSVEVSSFNIAKGEIYPKLKIETVPNLCPGKYTFSLSLGGEYTTPPIVIGSGGGMSYYTINASAGINGSISPFGLKSLPYGEKQTYKISPNNGYKIADVLVDNVSVGAVTTYTFNNINTNHIISATFVAAIIIKVGDANGDGRVDKYDIALMMANWGKTGINSCDFNDDEKVDEYDFSLLMLNWGL